MSTQRSSASPNVVQDDRAVDNQIEPLNERAPVEVQIRSLEGNLVWVRTGDIVQVLSPSAGYQGTMAYVFHFTKKGRINVCMPENHKIRTFAAKNICYVCDKRDEYALMIREHWRTNPDCEDFEYYDSEEDQQEDSSSDGQEDLDVVDGNPQPVAAHFPKSKWGNVLLTVCTIL